MDSRESLPRRDGAWPGVARNDTERPLTSTGTRETPTRREDGQILVLFALAAVVIIGMVGLVLDGGSTFAQRRGEQNSADLAAEDGANAYLNCSPSCTVAQRQAAAVNAANAAAGRNGYVNGVDNAVVSVPDPEILQSGAQVTVSITAPHANSFARVYGQNSWNVSVTASAISGSVDTAIGAAPWTMSIGAFNADGSPKYTSSNPQDFGEGNGSDYPLSALDISWTDFNGGNNVNTSEVAGIIDGSNVVTATFAFDQYLGQHNQGTHNALYGDVDQSLAGHDVPVPIVGPGSPNCSSPTTYQDGCFKGWAIFHVISAAGGSQKNITGYFISDFTQSALSVGECRTPPCGNSGDVRPIQQLAGSTDGLRAEVRPLRRHAVRLIVALSGSAWADAIRGSDRAGERSVGRWAPQWVAEWVRHLARATARLSGRP